MTKHDSTDYLEHERKLWALNYEYIAGVDEAGRGPLAGPVVTAAVILETGEDLPGVIDSKQVSANDREDMYRFITSKCKAYAIAAASSRRIDRMNILYATMYAMRKAVDRLKLRPDYILVDGNRLPDLGSFESEAIIGGDSKSRSIAAASIIAKVTRDRIMLNLHKFYPEYNFASHKGYGTVEHIEILKRIGPTKHHRYSFSPVRQMGLF